MPDSLLLEAAVVGHGKNWQTWVPLGVRFASVSITRLPSRMMGIKFLIAHSRVQDISDFPRQHIRGKRFFQQLIGFLQLAFGEKPIIQIA